MRFWRVIAALLCTNAAFAASELQQGQQILQNDQLVSDDGYYRLILQNDGNLAMYRHGSTVRWHANVRGAVRALLQSDGNFVLYDASSYPVWNSNTAGTPGARLVVQPDGNLVIYRSDGVPVWHIASDPAFYEAPPGTLRSGEMLHIGSFIHSPNRRNTLAMQGDGNLVYYNSAGAPVWNSGTAGRGVRATMESDGNFTVIDAAGTRLWQSNTSGRPGSILSAQDDNNLVVYDVNRIPPVARWNSLAASGGPGGGATGEQGKYPMVNVLPPGNGPTRLPLGNPFPICPCTSL